MKTPTAGAGLSMRLRDVLFVHRAVAPETVEPWLPAGLAVDTYDGDAYVGIVCLRATDAGPAMVPVGRSYGQLNVRTYVTHPEGPGVHFRSVDLGDRLGASVARRLLGLPAYDATVTVERRGERIRFESRREGSSARFAATYERDGEPFTPSEGSRAHFLTERYRFYTSRRGRLYAGDITHDPWRLFPAAATVEANTVFEGESDDETLAHYAPRLDVTARRVRRLRPDS